MHPENIHHKPYNFDVLQKVNPALAPYVFTNKYGTETIDFSIQDAVLQLNKALLNHHYQVDHWTIPKDYLCPPIPGRADYIYHLNDLLQGQKSGGTIKGLDIGVGANTIYPILANRIYGWKMRGTDISKDAVLAARKNIIANPILSDQIEICQQDDRGSIFKGIIKENEYFDFSMCNPPFHASEKDARKAAFRKIKNLGNQKGQGLNFGGQANELWCNGGEALFIKRMIKESVHFKSQIGWFTCLVSKKENLAKIYKQLEKINAIYKTIEMQQGNKKSRIIAWTFKN
ncbi:23S rRNA (adenine(1618)-N(6))-methyltransferase RlmF [Christiangramia sabulilitoris]|uniref:Ribosomal RNA large subunit methyltransferase F n=1 Tax=Christiangramia sabulilitoris TaxID=2583991 RepID=A0A550I3H5_9FLAO|nr:23S rRNA (adenine(1618)-N(6))-methyltransferase RlmF [Christiangramia sabulilitoris]TRO65530.1 23S rRNA (adenine(1618)-N(6))-methyltransferase RlmF [Christiangramia sabulilitoris]